MIVAALLMVLGLSMGIALVQLYGLRLSGVLVVPLFAVYILYDLLALPVFVVGVVASYVGLSALQRRTLLFGRRLLLASLLISMSVPFVLIGGLSVTGVFDLSLSALTFAGSILPGVAAYNYHQLEADRRREDVLVSLAALFGLVVLGGALVNLSLAPHVGRLTPPVLFSEGSDIAVARNAAVGDATLLEGVSLPLVSAAIVLGIVVSEGAYLRWGVRLVGIIALPLLALFALESVLVLPLYVLGVAVVYGIVSLIHRTTLLYGRVLLSLGLLVAIAGSVPIAIGAPVTSGLHLFFTGILVGIGAYNLHRTPAQHRSTSIALSAGAFALFLLGLGLAVSPSSGGALRSHLFVQLPLLVGALVAGGVTALRLERVRPSNSNRERRSIVTPTHA